MNLNPVLLVWQGSHNFGALICFDWGYLGPNVFLLEI